MQIYIEVLLFPFLYCDMKTVKKQFKILRSIASISRSHNTHQGNIQTLKKSCSKMAAVTGHFEFWNLTGEETLHKVISGNMKAVSRTIAALAMISGMSINGVLGLGYI